MGNSSVCQIYSDDSSLLKIYGSMFDSDTRSIISILDYCGIKYKLEKINDIKELRKGIKNNNP